MDNTTATQTTAQPQRSHSATSSRTTARSSRSLGQSAVAFSQQADKLSHQRPQEGDNNNIGDPAIEAVFVTPQDPVIVTAQNHRLPAVPLAEAHRLNVLKDDLERGADEESGGPSAEQEKTELPPPTQNGRILQKENETERNGSEGSLRRAQPPSHTNPLFPPLPLYGPPSLLRDAQCFTFRVSSFILSLAFLGVIVLGALFTSLLPFCARLFRRVTTFRDPDATGGRPFYEEEVRRKEMRKRLERRWKRRMSDAKAHVEEDKEEGGFPPDPGPGLLGPKNENREGEGDGGRDDGYVPTEGGPDPIVCDVGYYARRVGLDIEEFKVQTEDGFIIDLWHVYDPREYTPLPEHERDHRGPEVFGEPRVSVSATAENNAEGKEGKESSNPGRRFPVLLIHGLLQSSGAYCVNDDASLAFYLCKSGFDVWLGNNRCGFRPKHVVLEYGDPRMWCWNIRQMGVFDLPALTSRVLYETGFPKLGLVCHSQGTTQALVALAKEQRPELGEKLTVFCALAPAAYAGPLIGKMYFKFMRVISPAMFRLMFGIHAFIPFMMTMHRVLPPRVYGWLGYKVFSFLFNWTDRRWDRALRDRKFQFAPVYVSAESMRWWLGRECFARQKCILATKEEWRAEEREDIEQQQQQQINNNNNSSDAVQQQHTSSHRHSNDATQQQHRRTKPRGSTAWYNAQAPPFALWVCGSDRLVDGQRLLRRLQPQSGREPHVRLVHAKVIPEYEHLDVIWAMDAPRQVFCEVREVLWKTAGEEARGKCRVPRGCESVRVLPAGMGEDADNMEEIGRGEEGGNGGGDVAITMDEEEEEDEDVE